MHLGRVTVIATNVFREVIRDRVLYITGFFAVVFVAACTLVPYVAAGTESKILLDLGLALIDVFGLLIAIFVGTGLVNKEIENRTVYVLIAKPISHSEFILGKHLGLSVVLAVLLLAMNGIYMAILSVYQIPFPLNSLALAALYQLLKLSLITAVAILFGVFTSSLLAILFTFAIYIMGHLSRDLLTLGTMAKNRGLHQALEGLYLVLPDLARLDLKNQAVYGIELLPQPLTLLANGAYGIVYTALLLAIAILIFSRRQF